MGDGEIVRQPVTSTMLTSIGYDAEEQVLEVEFHGGRVYRYLEVPEEEYRDLLAASSIGSYFNDCIKDCYTYVPVSTGRSRRGL